MSRKAKTKQNFNGIDPFTLGGIYDAVKKALAAKPVKIHSGGMTYDGYVINEDIYTLESAVEKILGEYSWAKR